MTRKPLEATIANEKLSKESKCVGLAASMLDLSVDDTQNFPMICRREQCLYDVVNSEIQQTIWDTWGKRDAAEDVFRHNLEGAAVDCPPI